MQLRITMTISIVVSIGVSIFATARNREEALMTMISNLIGVMAGAALLWRSGDTFHPCERRLRELIGDLLHESAQGGSIPPLHVLVLEMPVSITFDRGAPSAD